MKQLSTILFVLIIALAGFSQKNMTRIIPAHSHNDYEHDHPLFDALSFQFKSVEADVYSIGDSLFVAHDIDQIKPGRTLRTLYLEPLKQIVRKNNGSVYGNSEEILLLIDIKDDAMRTYRLLHQNLEGYKEMMTTFENGQKKPGAVMVIVSGNRPLEYMQSQQIRYAGFDGRLENLESGLSSNLMPMVSDNWVKYFKWKGATQFSGPEKQKLHDLAQKALDNGYILRFWGTPNQTHEQRIAVWKELKEGGVGIIGADNLEELHDFLIKN